MRYCLNTLTVILGVPSESKNLRKIFNTFFRDSMKQKVIVLSLCDLYLNCIRLSFKFRERRIINITNIINFNDAFIIFTQLDQFGRV